MLASLTEFDCRRACPDLRNALLLNDDRICSLDDFRVSCFPDLLVVILLLSTDTQMCGCGVCECPQRPTEQCVALPQAERAGAVPNLPTQEQDYKLSVNIFE